MKHYTILLISFLLFFTKLNSQTIDIPISIYIDYKRVENNDSLLNIAITQIKDYFKIIIKYNNQKVKSYLYKDELSNTDSIHIFIQTKNRYKKANIDYIIIRENAPITYFGYYRSLDCRYYSHDILLYVKKDMERKKRNIFVDKFILIKCKFQIYIQEIKSKKMF